ncbi:unnamed protein product [Arctia plantaginis]|uniref:Uncharacterized protein n=1 Tax=Arctia plantaginis TaxID=874455 RepID=A0A8S0YY83_ARCPL|nr:unnamed protein product [Arctia plantaginis]
MSRIFLAIVFAIFAKNCNSFTISGPIWKNEISACASGGEHLHSYTFYLGSLTNYDTKFEDIRTTTTTVEAEGDLQLKTGKEGWVPKRVLRLSDASEASEYKQFRGRWRMDSYRGWASQSVEMVITVKFYDDDNVYMDTFVSAGSWMSVTCSETRAYVERLRIIL